jgi:hypothetical protein
VGEVMVDRGVGAYVYNENLVIGNQCMMLYNNGIEVGKGVDKGMKKVIKSQANVKRLQRQKRGK